MFRGIVEGREVPLVVEDVEKEQTKYDEQEHKALTIVFLDLNSELKSFIENHKMSGKCYFD